jgi:DNA adenine methylase Dam
MNFSLIKSPLNYTGGKFKLLPQILPLFPKEIDNFIDLFGGGANVSINVEAKKIYYNDTLTQVVDFLLYCKNNLNEKCLDEVNRIVNYYNLSKTNVEGYLKARTDFNNKSLLPGSNEMMFYTLVCHSFNNQIRFNKKGCFNVPFGKRYFNPEQYNKTSIFIHQIHNKDILFLNLDFRKLKLDNFTDKDFVYCDPPYLISCASYNEQDGWNENDERDLLNLLDSLNSRNVKFALSNVLENKGAENKILKEWSKKYNVHNLVKDYKNANYQRTDGKAVEVLITNY